MDQDLSRTMLDPCWMMLDLGSTDQRFEPHHPCCWWGGWGSNPRPRDYEVSQLVKRDHVRHKTPGGATLDTGESWGVAAFRTTASHAIAVPPAAEGGGRRRSPPASPFA